MLIAAIQSVLDRPVWSALTTGDRRFAEGGALALRFPRDIAPFGAIADESPEALAALRALVSSDGPVALVSVDRLKSFPGLKVVREAPIIQMVAEGEGAALTRIEPPIELGPGDVPEMLRLAERTKPGPFGPRTHELGQYIGVKIDGALAAPWMRRDQRGLCQSRPRRQRLCGVSRFVARPQAARGGSRAVPACLHRQPLGDWPLQAARI